MTVENIKINVNTNADKAAGKLLNLSKALDNVQSSAGKISGSKIFETLGKSIKKSNGPLTNFLSSLKRIAMYRVLRTIIKSITSAFSEGLQNAYAFSQGIITEGHRFSQALDSMSSSGLKMKNQLGSAFLALLAALAPIINQIISLVVKLADVISQIFSAFTGTTYLKAKDVFQSFADTAASGAKATKEWRNQLMGFDEINRLDAPTPSGGSGGASALDPSQMFEDTPIAEKWLNLVQKIKDNMDLIKDIAIGIGAALLAWRVIGILDDILGLNLAMSQMLGLAMAIGGATIYIQGFMDAWNNGPDWNNIIEMLLGVTLTAVGLGLAFGSIWAGLTLVIGGIGMLVAGCKNWIETGTLTTETFWLLEAGIAAVAIGLSIMTGSWIPLLIGGIAAVALAVVKNWDEIKQKLNEAVQKFKDAVEKHFRPMFDDIKQMLNGIKMTFQGIVDFVVGVFTGDFKRALKGIEEIVFGVKETIAGYIQSAIDFVAGLIGMLADAISWVSSLAQSINDLANANAVYNEQSGDLYATDPSMLSTSQSHIFPTGHYASGGFPDQGSLFIANEAGPEMVGTIGGRTAVATNADIVSAIEGGVYNAMASALSSSGGRGGATILNINGREFMRAIWNDQQAVASEHGVSLINA